MGLFGRNKKGDAAKEPAKPAARAEPDFFSPFWSDWPPRAETPAPPPVVDRITPVDDRVTPVVDEVPVVPPRTQPPKPANPPTVSGPAVVVQRVHAISDVPPPVRAIPVETPSSKMRAAVDRRDWPVARAIAEEILAKDPTDLDAYVCIETSAQRMRELNELRLGARDRVLRQSLPDDWLPDMELDPQVAFLLSRVDGSSTIEEILEISGIPKDDAVRILLELLEDRVIEAISPEQRHSSRPPR
jgi:hypothetical protein